MAKTETFQRAIIAAASLALVATLSACSGNRGASESNDNSDASPTPNSSVNSSASDSPDIANPKDASAVDVCSLLSGKAAKALEVDVTGQKKAGDLLPGGPPYCLWKGSDGSLSVSLAALNDRSIERYYKYSEEYIDFKRLAIAGYPAVRANKTKAEISCDLFLASNKNQVVVATAFIPSEKVGKVDPCELSKKALKLSVSSWPAAK